MGRLLKNSNYHQDTLVKICGQNQHILVIPCHRVIRSDGSLAGFSATGGISLKENF